MDQSQRKLLVLDLDETLIYATETSLDRDPDFAAGPYSVYQRPFLTEFLDYCFARFDVGIWTTSTETYAEAIVDAIIHPDHHLAFLWSRDRCTWVFDEELYERIQIKKLEKLRRRGYAPESIIVIDDSLQVWRNSYGNLIKVSKYEGASEDDELRILPVYLEILRDAVNIRAIEKRGWRSRVRA